MEAVLDHTATHEECSALHRVAPRCAAWPPAWLNDPLPASLPVDPPPAPEPATGPKAEPPADADPPDLAAILEDGSDDEPEVSSPYVSRSGRPGSPPRPSFPPAVWGWTWGLHLVELADYTPAQRTRDPLKFVSGPGWPDWYRATTED